MKLLLLLNLAITFYLTGLIFTIQAVHYPGFIYVDRNLFPKFHLFHVRRISIIVMVPMVLEFIFAVALAYVSPTMANLILLVMVLAVWASTAILSVPRHNKLTEIKNPKLISELINTNWPRTIIWAARAILLCILCYKAI